MIGMIRPLRRMLGLRSTISASALVVAGAASWMFWPAPPLPVTAGGEDRFEGRVVLVPSDVPGSNMRLAEDFAYIDPNGKKWAAPAGLETDGASIPSILYPVVGHPFDGSYLKAAIVHDAGCPSDKATWEQVHLMFYEALLKCGVGESKAKVMYAAVYHFGPRWELSAADESPFEDNIVAKKLESATGDAGEAAARYDEATRTITVDSADPAAEEAVREELFEKCKAWVEREDPSLEKIRDWRAGMGEK